MKLNNKNALFIVAQKNFRDEELFEVRRVLESSGIKTSVGCINSGEAFGSLGRKVNIDLTLDQILVSKYDAIIFVGGSGSAIYYDNKTALNIIKECKFKGKIICGICAGVGVLANAEILNKINCTGWYEIKDLIEKKSGNYTGNEVEVSGKIITANGPKAAKQFGEEIVKMLNKEFD